MHDLAARSPPLACSFWASCSGWSGAVSPPRRRDRQRALRHQARRMRRAWSVMRNGRLRWRQPLRIVRRGHGARRCIRRNGRGRSCGARASLPRRSGARSPERAGTREPGGVVREYRARLRQQEAGLPRERRLADDARVPGPHAERRRWPREGECAPRGQLRAAAAAASAAVTTGVTTRAAARRTGRRRSRRRSP
jgi:hypothetical protein